MHYLKLIKLLYIIDREALQRWVFLSQLRDLCHGFPEWKDPQGTSIPISIREILKAGGHDDEEIRATVRELKAMADADEALRA